MILKSGVSVKFETPVRDGRQMRAMLYRRVRAYERRYEMSSEQMVVLLHEGHIRETAELIKWMHACHVVRLFERKTRMTGTPMTTTEPSMRSG